ncbi:hypothetical protein [Haloplanus salilacus]|uniref:hypothetical protein n=1 Tax=Haloplanus salilacus TaxID=2949994 RepID=UPI0030CE8331
MGEETITVDGEQISLTTSETRYCSNCEEDVGSFMDSTCPGCGREDSVRVISEDYTERGKFLYYGTGTIEDMAEALEKRAKFLRVMKENGWERRGVAGDDYSRLTKTKEGL